MKKRIALVTNDTSAVGGLPTMINFLYDALLQSERYEPHLISLATSASDSASVRLKSPSTWFRRPRVENKSWRGKALTHFGAFGSELEFQRYRGHTALTQLLNTFDLIQFVVGSPPWVCAAADVARPKVLWTATTTRADRISQIQEAGTLKRAWSSIMMPVTERYERRAVVAADRVLALSEYTRRNIAALGCLNVSVAPCGVDTRLFRPDRLSQKDYILCVARLSDPRKNVRLLLTAYESLKRQMTRVPDLYLVGDPPSFETQKYLQKSDLADNVRIFGSKSGEELAELYRNALFFVLSSNEEGLGIVILEAMASGLPVITTDCGGPATAIRDQENGFLTGVGDAASLAAAMRYLIEAPAIRKSMGIKSREIAEQNFSIEAAGKVFLDTYDQVLNPRTDKATTFAKIHSGLSPARAHE